MAYETQAYTTAEAAFVLREPIKSVKKALDDGPVEARLVRRAGAQVRALGWSDLFYLFAVQRLRDELTPKARHEFYRALKRTTPRDVGEVRFGRFSVSVGDLQVEMAQRANDLAALSETVDFRDDGEALIRGTRIEAHRIAALLAGGMTAESVSTDYPSLTLDQIETARTYAEAYPKLGRPYPAKTVKRAVEGAGLEALDEVLGE